MRKEHAAFASRLRMALAQAKIDARPVVIERLLARRGVLVTAQAISGWLAGRHMPKPDAMRAIAYLVGVQPYELQFGLQRGVRDEGAVWPDPVAGEDHMALQAFLALPEPSRAVVRELIHLLTTSGARHG